MLALDQVLKVLEQTDDERETVVVVLVSVVAVVGVDADHDDASLACLMEV